jgi:hypothetical protein
MITDPSWMSCWTDPYVVAARRQARRAALEAVARRAGARRHQRHGRAA